MPILSYIVYRYEYHWTFTLDQTYVLRRSTIQSDEARSIARMMKHEP
jgi:hypothetical protein